MFGVATPSTRKFSGETGPVKAFDEPSVNLKFGVNAIRTLPLVNVPVVQ
jgi:hypothetical protein